MRHIKIKHMRFLSDGMTEISEEGDKAAKKTFDCCFHKVSNFANSVLHDYHLYYVEIRRESLFTYFSLLVLSLSSEAEAICHLLKVGF